MQILAWSSDRLAAKLAEFKREQMRTLMEKDSADV